MKQSAAFRPYEKAREECKEPPKSNKKRKQKKKQRKESGDEEFLSSIVESNKKVMQDHRSELFRQADEICALYSTRLAEITTFKENMLLPVEERKPCSVNGGNFMAWLYTPHPTAFKTDSEQEDPESSKVRTDRPNQIMAKYNVLDNSVRKIH